MASFCVRGSALSQDGGPEAQPPSVTMAASEKRKPPAAGSEPIATATANGGPEDAAEFLLQAGVTDMVRTAVLKVLEARPEEPVEFLAAYFGKLAAHRSPEEEEEEEEAASSGAGPGQPQRQLQLPLERALWHLGLAHHSHRTAFNNNVSAAYDALSGAGRRSKPGVSGKLYSELLRMMCRDQGAPEGVLQPLLRKITCRDHEAVPFDVFRYGALACLVLFEFLAKAEALYDTLDGGGGSSRGADKRVCVGVLGTLEEALGEAPVSAPIRYLEAGSKLGPDGLALAMDRALKERKPSVAMKKDEFLTEAAAIFVAKVKPID